jgi:hypothetical protein
MGGWRLPEESVSGFQYCFVLFMGPLWFMRAGRRFGVHFWGAVGWMDSIVNMRCIDTPRLCILDLGNYLIFTRSGINAVRSLSM